MNLDNSARIVTVLGSHYVVYSRLLNSVLNGLGMVPDQIRKDHFDDSKKVSVYEINDNFLTALKLALSEIYGIPVVIKRV